MKATEINDVRSAMADMAHGIRKPDAIAWRLYDAARGRVAAPLGPYPQIAEEVAAAGGSFYHIAKPLTVMLAHLRRRCTSKMSGDMRQAMVAAKKESDEAEVSAFQVALSMNCLGASDLSALERNAAEASLGWEKVKELAECKLVEIEEAHHA